MSSGELYGPFILRFSKSMYRPNPRVARGAGPREAGGAALNPYFTSEKLKNGFNYYKSFEHNLDMPVFSKLVLKKGSLAKSLRYHFFKTADVSPSSSTSEDTLVFAINSLQKLNHLCSIISYSRNRAFRASLNHLADLDIINEQDKLNASVITETNKGHSLIKLFTSENDPEKLLSFVKYGTNAPSASLTEIGSQKYVRVKTSEISCKHEALFTHSLVQSVCPEPDIFFTEQYTRHSEVTLECINKRNIEKTYPKAGLVDSGVSEESFLKEWELAKLSFVDTDDKNFRHGTFVCGRLLAKDEQFGGITYLNIEMIPSKSRLTLESFERNMRIALDKYHKTVKIYNISLGTNIQVGDFFTPAAGVLDELQYEYDVLFIISAGNAFGSSGYDSKITSPAESVNSITVGSVSHTDTNLQKKYSPSLFSRNGPGPCGFIKPDLASFGGAHEKRYGKLRPVGVFSIGEKNELAEDSGTSHAAPLISALAAKIYEKYSLAFKSTNMTKTMLIHYTFLNNHQREVCYLRGYGTTPEAIASDDKNATFLHEGKAVTNEIIELPGIPVPDDMIEDGKVAGEIILTLTYKADTDINFPHFYCMYNIEASLGFYKNGRWTSILTSKNIAGAPQDDLMNRNELNERFKWNPTKVLRKEFKRQKIPHSLSLRLITSKRDFYSKKPEIAYALAISFLHKEKNLYQCLRNMSKENNQSFEHSSELWKTCG